MTDVARDSLSTDTLIVGAGPIGLELAVVLKHMGVDYLHVDAGQVGETVSRYPTQTTFFSSPERIAIAGVPLRPPGQSKATREGYLDYLHAVVDQFDLAIRGFEPVRSLVAVDGGFETLTDRARISSKRVVLAIGDMHTPRLLNIPGEDRGHVSHHAQEPHRYFRRRLLIVGGKNAAVETALRCHRAGARVTLSYRGAAFDPAVIKYWLLPEINALIEHGAIGFVPESKVVAIDEQAVVIDAVGGRRTVPADAVLLLTGYDQDKTLFVSAGVELEGANRAPRFNPDTMETNVPGLYVAGTAAAGTQNQFKLFIENSHPHVAKIAKALTGRDAPAGLINSAAKTYGLAES